MESLGRGRYPGAGGDNLGDRVGTAKQGARCVRTQTTRETPKKSEEVGNHLLGGLGYVLEQ